MNKQEFLQMLTSRLADLSEQDLFRLTEFFSETIDDRVEDGMTEEEAVSALGNPEQILREIRQDNGGVPVPSAPRSQPEHPCDTDESGAHVIITDPVRSIRIDTKYTDIRLQSGFLPSGTTLSATGPDGLTWSLENGVLSLRCDSETGNTGKFSLQGILSGLFNGFSSSEGELVVTLPADGLRGVTVHTASGNISMEDFAVDGSLEAASASGDVTVSALTLGGALVCRSTSGDVELSQTEAAGALTCSSTSGDVSLSAVRAGSVNLQSLSGDVDVTQTDSESAMTAQTTSGDLTVDGGSIIDALACSSVSGDVHLSHLSAERVLIRSSSGDLTFEQSTARAACELHTASGDIRIDAIDAAECTLTSSSGDIHGSLAGHSDQYDFRCTSRIGDVHVPTDRGERPVQARTASGDIRLWTE